MSKRQELVSLAQDKVRSGGYGNFSFRELASEVGIKSASVHYHFPTKADLGAELAKQYTKDFLAALGKPSELIKLGKDPIATYISLFRTALVRDKKMCLCGLLGAESDCLPDKVKVETKRFFEQNLAWLEDAYTLVDSKSNQTAKAEAVKLLVLLEGAMLISKGMENNELFDIALS